MSTIAFYIFCLGILGLFWIGRDKKAQTSGALWIPVVWMFFAGSRSFSQWIAVGPPKEIDAYVEGSPIDQLVYGGLLLLGSIVIVNRWRHAERLFRANGSILFFFAYCALSMLWSDYPVVAFKRWLKALGDLVMVLIVLTDRDPFGAVKRFLARLGFVLIPLSVLFIKFFPEAGRRYGRYLGDVRYTGVTANKNSLGTLCMIFGLATVWRLIAIYQDRDEIGRTRQLLAHGVVLAMVGWLFWLVDSMTSLICFLIGSALLLAANFGATDRRPAIAHAATAGMIFGSLAVLFLGMDPGILDVLGRDSTLTDRTEMWPLLISLTPNFLLGTGFESFWLGPRLEETWSVYSWGPNQAHNGYLEIFLNLGWTGVALLAVVLLKGYQTVFAAFRRELPTSSLMLAYFVALVLYNLTEASLFRMMKPSWIILLLSMIRVPEPES